MLRLRNDQEERFKIRSLYDFVLVEHGLLRGRADGLQLTAKCVSTRGRDLKSNGRGLRVVSQELVLVCCLVLDFNECARRVSGSPVCCRQGPTRFLPTRRDDLTAKVPHRLEDDRAGRIPGGLNARPDAYRYFHQARR